MDQAPNWPAWAQEALHVEMRVKLDWRDRLVALLGGVVELHATVLCEQSPGYVNTQTSVRAYFPQRRA